MVGGLGINESVISSSGIVIVRRDSPEGDGMGFTRLILLFMCL